MSAGEETDFDRIDDMPVPRERTHVVGHLKAQAELMEGVASGRLHHAWLLTGPEGIGKATLAFQFAQYLLRAAPPRQVSNHLPNGENDAGATKVRHLSHPDFVYVRRSINPENNKLRTVISVHDIKHLSQVFGSTSGVGGWRVAIIDTADDMNQNSANALLKLLEEPPRKALFLIISHSPARLLPTIRSRCRKLALEPLPPEEVGQVVDELAKDADPADVAAVLTRCEGSVRRALTLLAGEGLQLIQQIEEVLFDQSGPDIRKLHALGDKLARKGDPDAMTLFLDTIAGFVAGRVRAGVESGEPLGPLARLGEIEEGIRRQYATVKEYNLDMKQFVISSLGSIASAIGR